MEAQLTRLYSSLHSAASLLLRASVSRLLPQPMRLTQTPRTNILNPTRLAQLPRTTIPIPAHPMEPRRTRLALPEAYELITHGLDLCPCGSARVPVGPANRDGFLEEGPQTSDIEPEPEQPNVSPFLPSILVECLA